MWVPHSHNQVIEKTGVLCGNVGSVDPHFFPFPPMGYNVVGPLI